MKLKLLRNLPSGAINSDYTEAFGFPNSLRELRIIAYNKRKPSASQIKTKS